MPSKESKVPKNYPPCNRAFALRMMNPTAYSDNNVSPFDQEIKPLPTKRISKAFRDDSDGSNVSFDENSNVDTATLSPVSSLASLQDMDLNGIDENTYGKDAFTLTRAKSVIDSFGRSANNGKPRANTVGQADNPMVRCQTSLGEVQPFQRHDVHRMTTPARASTSLNQARESLPSANGYKQEGRKCLQDPKVCAGRSASTSKSESKGLSRTPSLRERSRSEQNTVRPRLLSKIRPSRAAFSPNQTEYTDNLSKHSDTFRSQEHDARTHTTDDPAKLKKNISPRTANSVSKSIAANATTVTPRPSGSDLSESDNSIILSEADAYNPANNPRRFPLSGHSRPVTSYQTALNDSAGGRRSLDVSTENSGENTQRSLVQRRSLPPSSPSPNGYATGSDPFSQQLADVCHLMSEKHPGEFQILESLVNMQAAYEAKELQHRQTLRYLHEKIEELEKRMERGERRRPPSMSAIILPLAKATTAFQKQLEDIASMCDLCITGRNASVSVQTNVEQSGSANDISMEANAVADQIRRVCFNRDIDTLANSESLFSTGKLVSSEQLDKKDPGNQSILDAEKHEDLVNGCRAKIESNGISSFDASGDAQKAP